MAAGPWHVAGGAGVGQVGEEVADVPGERVRLPEFPGHRLRGPPCQITEVIA